MYAWIIPKDMSHPYLSPIFARAVHSGDWPENEKGWHEFCIVLDNSKSNLIEIDTYSRTMQNSCHPFSFFGQSPL